MYTHLSAPSSLPRYRNQQQPTSWTPSVVPTLVSPPPPSATNSLRSTPLSLRTVPNATLNATLMRNSMLIEPIPMDVMMANELSNADMKVDNHKANALPEQTVVDTKVSPNILPIFIMESLSIICLASLAYFLRFTDAFGVLTRGFHCDDDSISYPFQPFANTSKPLIGDINSAAFYSIAIGFPILMIIICEFSREAFISYNNNLKRKKVIAAHSGCVTCRIYLVQRRIFRFIGGFLYGLLIVSITADALKLVSGRLRPYFRQVCQSIADICFEVANNNSNNTWLTLSHVWIDASEYDDDKLCPNQTSLLREARLSFPSWTASIATFAAFFFVLYINVVITFRSGHIIRLWFSSASLLLIMIVMIGRVTTHNSHVSDVIASALIGVSFASYIAFVHLNSFADKKDEIDEENGTLAPNEDEEDAWFWKYFHIPRVNLLRRSARYFRRRDNEEINAHNSNGSAYVNPAFEHKDFEHKDIINNDRRSAYQESYRH